MAEQSIGMTTGLGDGTAGGYTADRMRDMELRTFNTGMFMNTDGTLSCTMSGSGSSTLTIGIGNAIVSGWFYQNTTAATISVSTGVSNGNYSLVIVANNTAGTAAVTKTVAGVATVPAYTVRLALATSAQLSSLTYVSVGTCTVTGGVLSALNYDESSLVTSLALPYQSYQYMSGGTATLTTTSTYYGVGTYSSQAATGDNIFSQDASSGVVTINRAGLYNISAYCIFAASTTSYKRLAIAVGGTNVLFNDSAANGTAAQYVSISGQYVVNATQTVNLRALSNAAAQTITSAYFVISLV